VVKAESESAGVKVAGSDASNIIPSQADQLHEDKGSAEVTVHFRVSFRTALLVAVIFDLLHLSTNEILTPLVRSLSDLI
jgi:hypothetical protein